MNRSGRGVSVPEYASTRLIAYLGNKRSLLPRLAALFSELAERRPLGSFLDPFAGSGSVSRLARSMGMRVMAADHEEYAYWVNLCWLGVAEEEVGSLFMSEGGLEAVLERLNRLHPEREDEDFPAEPYLARHYAPRSTAQADYRRERLFYTRENAVFLDRARSAVEALRPALSDSLEAGKERALLLGPLVYEAATHANTSGVFKAFHKGFGGHSGDALGRILAPMRLEPPLLWPGTAAEVGLSGASSFCAAHPAELCYLDPPYNQHQYGSNYHLLNTLVRWDQRPVSEERREDGSLVSKAGIPPEWKRSRSAFCSKSQAPGAFRELLAAIDARFIVLSYNDEGLVPAEELYDLLSEGAEVSLLAEDYVRYRGGRQSAGRRNANHELLFIAERREGIRAGSGQPRPCRKALVELETSLRLTSAFIAPLAPSRIRESCPAFDADGGPGLYRRGERLVFRGATGTFDLGLFSSMYLECCPDPASFSPEERSTFASLLEPLLARDNAEACKEALSLIEACRGQGKTESGKLRRLALTWLRKLVHPRYREQFSLLYGRALRLLSAEGDPADPLSKGLGELRLLAKRRMGWEPEVLSVATVGSAGPRRRRSSAGDPTLHR